MQGQDSRPDGAEQRRWARIFAASRSDYVHLRVFSWVAGKDEEGRFFPSAANREAAFGRMKDALESHFGHETGQAIASELGKKAAEDGFLQIGRQVDRHIRNLAYEHSQLCRTSGRNSLDERLDMELAVLEWAYMASGGETAFEQGSILCDDWIGSGGLVARLSPQVKEAASPEIAKLRRAIPPMDPEAEPDAFDVADLYDVEYAVAKAVAASLTSGGEEAERAHEAAAAGIRGVTLGSAQVLLRTALDRMESPAEARNWKQMDVISGPDWDLYFSDSRQKRLAAALSLVVDEACTDHAARLELQSGTLCRRLAAIDQLFPGRERGVECHLTRLHAALGAVMEMEHSPKGQARETAESLEAKGYLDSKDVDFLKRMDAASAMRPSPTWKDGDVMRLARAAGGMDVLEAALAEQVATDVADGKGDGHAEVCRTVVGRIGRLEAETGHGMDGHGRKTRGAGKGGHAKDGR